MTLSCLIQIKSKSIQVVEMCKILAELDIAVHMGIFARQNHYVRPVMTDQ
jgi:DNA mismatch repair ATPase MutS